MNDTKYWNKEYRNTMISLYVGKTIVDQRVTDILSLVGFTSSDPRLAGHSIQLKANGTYGSVAVHVTFLDERIEQSEIIHSVKSYFEFLKNPMQRDVYTNTIPGVLKCDDLKDLAEKAGKGRRVFQD